MEHSEPAATAHMTHVEMFDKFKAEGVTLDREYLSNPASKVQHRERI